MLECRDVNIAAFLREGLLTPATPPDEYIDQPAPKARQKVARGGALRAAPGSIKTKPPSPERAIECAIVKQSVLG
jgi:hypothetical protein